MTRSIAIVGCGGVNSWFVEYLNEVLKLFDKRDITYVKIFDNDEVEEKNLKRGNQNFVVEDLMEQKAEMLGKRNNFDFECSYITEENIDSMLSPFSDIILGVDNNKTRRLVYNYCILHKKYCLDLRAQGTQLMYVVVDYNTPMTYYDEKYFANKEVMERKGSCQLTADIKNDHLENANKAIAFLGAYCIFLKHLRNEKPEMSEFKMVY